MYLIDEEWNCIILEILDGLLGIKMGMIEWDDIVCENVRARLRMQREDLE